MSGMNEDFINWNELFMGIALLTSTRSKDPHNQVGACIVNEKNRILATGYNGAPNGFLDTEFPWDSLGEETGDFLKIKDTFVIHAEQNAIDNFRGNKKDLEGSTLYVTWFPCHECAKRIVQNGIKKVVYARMYSKPLYVEATKRIFQYAQVEIVQYKEGVEQEELMSCQQQFKKIMKNFGTKNKK